MSDRFLKHLTWRFDHIMELPVYIRLVGGLNKLLRSDISAVCLDDVYTTAQRELRRFLAHLKVDVNYNELVPFLSVGFVETRLDHASMTFTGDEPTEIMKSAMSEAFWCIIERHLRPLFDGLFLTAMGDTQTMRRTIVHAWQMASPDRMNTYLINVENILREPRELVTPSVHAVTPELITQCCRLWPDINEQLDDWKVQVKWLYALHNLTRGSVRPAKNDTWPSNECESKHKLDHGPETGYCHRLGHGPGHEPGHEQGREQGRERYKYESLVLESFPTRASPAIGQVAATAANTDDTDQYLDFSSY